MATLEERLETLLESTEGIREQIVEENRRAKSRARRHLAAIALALLVGVFGVKATVDANNERDSARVASCLQYNKQQAAQAGVEVGESEDFVSALEGRHPTAKLQAAAKAFNREHDRKINNAHAGRDCSPAGIRRYLSTPTTKERP